MTAAKLQVPVAHVEAGLRSFDRRMPEELNRLQTDAIWICFWSANPAGEANLLQWIRMPERIRYVGNVMIDSLVRELGARGTVGFPGRARPRLPRGSSS